jgi:hypothetical protein
MRAARRLMIAGVLLVSVIAIPAHAARRPTAPVPQQVEPPPAAPVLSEEARWPPGVLIGVASLFAAALLIGPFYRQSRPAELPPTHSHDEPPGSSHHHGRAGTYDHYPPERRQG